MRPNPKGIARLSPPYLSISQHLSHSRSLQQMASFAFRSRRPSFGDSNYYPAGWDRDRLLRASIADLHGLPAGEFDRMRAGMIEKMGPDEFQRWVNLLPSSASLESGSSRTQIEVDARETTTDQPVQSRSSVTPDFVRVVQEQYATGVWGFVIFDSVGHEMSDNVRQEQRERLKAQIRAPLERYADVAGVMDAAERFHLEWVQVRTAEGDAELVARRYGASLEQGTLPKTLSHPSFCLNFSPKSLNSLLRLGESHGAFVQVVAPISTDQEYEENERQLAEEQDEMYPTHFNVPLDSLLPGLYPVWGRQSLSLSELGGHLKPDEIWESGAT
ncbi:hypothetical protein F5Y12DRAFT_758692 [Xylaria sp. FL1777]|nr:hypothetical protein F5Y12DRAFT_758692 [Xylaria sp. FL1777]